MAGWDSKLLWTVEWWVHWWKINESVGRSQRSPVGCSGHQDHTHGVGVTWAWAPAGQHDDNIALFEEAPGLTCRQNRTHLNKDNRHLEWVQQSTVYSSGVTNPVPWRSWRACPRPLPTHRGPAWCREPGRCRGTGGLGERSERSGSQPGWEREAGTWRSGGLICTYPQGEKTH